MFNFKRKSGDSLSSFLKKNEKDIGPQVQKALNTIALRILSKVKSQELSGQSLKVRTGTLRRSMTATASGSGLKYTQTIGSNVKYAAVHEFGFRGPATVPQHLRTINQAFGRPIDPKQIVVRQYVKQMNIKAKFYLNRTVDKYLPEFKKELFSNLKKTGFLK